MESIAIEPWSTVVILGRGFAPPEIAEPFAVDLRPVALVSGHDVSTAFMRESIETTSAAFVHPRTAMLTHPLEMTTAHFESHPAHVVISFAAHLPVWSELPATFHQPLVQLRTAVCIDSSSPLTFGAPRRDPVAQFASPIDSIISVFAFLRWDLIAHSIEPKLISTAVDSRSVPALEPLISTGVGAGVFDWRRVRCAAEPQCRGAKDGHRVLRSHGFPFV